MEPNVKKRVTIDMSKVEIRKVSHPELHIDEALGFTSKIHIDKTLNFTSKYSFKFKVYIQGTQTSGKVAFLTVHDVGSNHVPFCDFVENDYMKHVTENSVWYHVCLPGQDEFEEEFSEGTVFPTLDAIANDLVNILDFVNLQAVVGFGEGAGANILLRFGLLYPNRCFGLVLINCTASSARVDERFYSTLDHFVAGGKKFAGKFRHMMTWSGSTTGSSPESRKISWTANLPTHKNGSPGNILNVKNVEKYAEAYSQRSDISKFLATDLNVDCLVITGRLSHFKPMCEELMHHMDKLHTTLLVIDGATDVLYESQKDTVRSLILFCKGCGVLISVPMIGLEKEFNIVRIQQEHNKNEETDAQRELLRQIQIYESLLFEH